MLYVNMFIYKRNFSKKDTIWKRQGYVRSDYRYVNMKVSINELELI